MGGVEVGGLGCALRSGGRCPRGAGQPSRRAAVSAAFACAAAGCGGGGGGGGQEQQQRRRQDVRAAAAAAAATVLVGRAPDRGAEPAAHLLRAGLPRVCGVAATRHAEERVCAAGAGQQISRNIKGN